MGRYDLIKSLKISRNRLVIIMSFRVDSPDCKEFFDIGES